VTAFLDGNLTPPSPERRGGNFPPISGDDKGGVSLREDCFACQSFKDNLAVTASFKAETSPYPLLKGKGCFYPKFAIKKTLTKDWRLTGKMEIL